MAFIFSCSSDSSHRTYSTYFVSQYVIPSNSKCCIDDDDDDGNSRPLSDYTFDEVLGLPGEILYECSGYLLNTAHNITEEALRTELAKAGMPPAYCNEFMNELNRRKNHIQFIYVGNNPSYQKQYCFFIEYYEKE
jgi:hypothetical protein